MNTIMPGHFWIGRGMKDRCTKSHEYIFLLSKSAQYYYDNDAIKEPAKYSNEERYSRTKEDHKSQPTDKQNGIRIRKPAGWDTSRQGAHGSFHREGRAPDIEYTITYTQDRNKRSVWTVPTRPYKGAHFATFPPDLVEPMILAGSATGDIVFDPFAGTATVGQVCAKHSRNFIGLELNPEYIELAKNRMSNVQIMLTA